MQEKIWLDKNICNYLITSVTQSKYVDHSARRLQNKRWYRR